MSGLLRRLTRRRPATADETGSPAAGSSEPAAAPADTPAEPGGDRPVPAADEQATQILPATGEQPAAEQTSPGAEWATSAMKPVEPQAPAPPEEPRTEATQAEPQTDATQLQAESDQPTAFAAQRPQGRDLPAGLDPGDLSTGPAASARRGKLRRRLRYLRHVRELLLRDLGGFTYEIHRTAGGAPQESHRKLTTAKASRIAALDAEVGVLEARLGEPHAPTVLREAGIGGTCPECGELHASDAHYCSRCGAPLDEKARAQRQVAAAAAPVTASHPTPEPQPASVLWAGGPRPSAGQEPEERPSAATGWLASQATTFDRAARPDEGKAAKPDVPAATPEKPAAIGDEPVTTPAAKADEPVAPVAQPDEPAAAPEKPAATADEPKTGEPATASDEPAATAGEPTATDEPAAAAGEPAATDEPAATETPVVAGDESAPAVEAAGEPAKPAKPKRARAKKPPKPAPEDQPFEPNGRRDEDVPSPVRSADPLSSRREQGQ